MTDREREALKAFEKDIARLAPWTTDDVNIFEILNVAKKETAHSNFLAWLLDPKGPHSFGGEIIKGFVREAIQKNQNKEEIRKRLDIKTVENWDYMSFKVDKEIYLDKDNRNNRIDILLHSEKTKTVICIENKIDSKEHKNQTKRYREDIERERVYKDYSNKLYVFLSPEGDEAYDKDFWAALSYRSVVEIVKKQILGKSPNENEKKARLFVEDYIRGVEKHMGYDAELQKICVEIYNNNRKALELIEKYKPDKRSQFIIEFKERLREQFTKSGGGGILPNDSKYKLFFVTRELSHKFQFEIKTDEEGLITNKDDVKCYYTVQFDEKKYICT
jgi:hypothetical protein